MSILDQIENRSLTNSVKWDRMAEIYQLEDPNDILPMWIADMDFAAPAVLIDAFKKRLEHPVFGYTFEDAKGTQAFVDWAKKRHGFTIDPSWILYQQGVVPAIAAVVETFTKENEAVIITPPIYPPFFNVPKNLNRTVKECPLDEVDGVYSFDFEKFDNMTQQEDVKLFILCHPHNPGGFEWSIETLQEITRICEKNNVLILSDEIHADLILDGRKHTPLAQVAGDAKNRIITCMAPTKTFNIAGIQVAMMIVSDEELRARLREHMVKHAQMSLNIFAGVALKTLYSKEGEEWLEQLLPYISENMDLAISRLTEIEGIHIYKPNATYLLWIDYRKTGKTEEEIMDLLLTKGRLALEPGSKYGEQGKGFLRMNVSCPRSLVEEGIKRFTHALT